ncbi:hypothetical protein GCK72_022294 [Caenorhabditis remanei]|uniref:Uncharacterized protein n=1 Tax=Caenorhabditis remanei TaxID=31234 RepID=E3M9X4_CAERE|nr:hypothetical protein GCK72_022295 [Caenorhabditis remanei]XP_003107034.2 hypothetical protein GCK72_022294 [Caenorhabditis remanei]EFO96764.1 hypothetical protein CRE_17183 [Caenorhabditis remanei]KAF1745847.1 hypothetical protein GCK72_022294 [Caenorhabditis remanei]KAF1745848.1 hypothetical protein GCK72_022295 [Caenorhabditis remanei]
MKLLLVITALLVATVSSIWPFSEEKTEVYYNVTFKCVRDYCVEGWLVEEDCIRDDRITKFKYCSGAGSLTRMITGTISNGDGIFDKYLEPALLIKHNCRPVRLGFDYLNALVRLGSIRKNETEWKKNVTVQLTELGTQFQVRGECF